MGSVSRTHGTEERCPYFQSEKLKGKDNFEDSVADGRIILEWHSGKEDVMLWTGCIWLRIGTSSGIL
jgi:hypothetical protein